MSKVDKAVRVPKRLAGVKIPKGLRRDLKRLGKDKHGRAEIKTLLTAAAAGLATPPPQDSAARKATRTRTAKPKTAAARRAATPRKRAPAKTGPSGPANETGA